MVTRVSLVDAVRGFALFGVVVSNVAVVWGSGSGLVADSALDGRVGYLASYLITGKFLALFSLLFGASFGLYLQRCADTRQTVVPRYLRRLGILFLLGVLNRMLFGPDILMTYAVLGAVLLLFRNASERVLILAMVGSLALPELWQTIAGWIGYQSPPPIATRAERLRLATDGPYLELVRIRALMLVRWWNELLRQGSAYLPLFIAGLLAARRQLFHRADERRTQLRVLWYAGLALTVFGYVAQAMLRPGLSGGAPWIGFVFGIVWRSTTFVQGVSYGAGIALLWSVAPRARAALSLLSPAGRMALTNYLAASLIITTIVVSTGSYGRIGLATASLCGVILWMMEIAWSSLWLRRYEFGPVEWLWRRLAYGRSWDRGSTVTPAPGAAAQHAAVHHR